MAPNVVLYGSGLFGRNVPATNQAQLTQIQQSGFTTVILWTIHVDADGALVYNDTVIVSADGIFSNTFNYLPPLLTQLTSTGSVQQVLFCIGSGGVNDFHHIQTLLSTQQGKVTLVRNFSALAAALPIDGYDFDDEDLFDADVDAQLTEILCSNNRMIVTYCPYTLQSVWSSAVEQVYAWDQQQNPPLGQSVRWWNLQCYSGGAFNNPLDWAKALPGNAGISDPNAYIVPGYDASVQDPSSIQKTFQQFSGTGINGGFIWNSSAIFDGSYTPRDYAQAILNGLAGVSAGKIAEPASPRLNV